MATCLGKFGNDDKPLDFGYLPSSEKPIHPSNIELFDALHEAASNGSVWVASCRACHLRSP
jgi:hypothetical protein